jgi:tetratricopeptide (TPR) repeat protein
MWAHLDRLRGVRLSVPMVGELRRIAARIPISDTTPAAGRTAAALQWFKDGNLHFEAGRFSKAVECYRAALQEDQPFWDAWSNLALAEMHGGNDLVALVVLTALNRANPKYAGAGINLSVCLERLGLREEAYATAGAVVREQAQTPMAAYNLAWFENARGQYDAAGKRLTSVFETLPSYAPALWLRSVNKMEAGVKIDAGELKALPAADQAEGLPRVARRPVAVAMAGARDRDAIVAQIPLGTPLVVSAKIGDWYAFYWPIAGTKHRLWINQACLGPEGTQTATAQSDAGRYIGTWVDPETNERTVIQEIGGEPRVVSVAGRSVDATAWKNGALTWSYLVPKSRYRVTFKALQVTEERLKCLWGNDHGGSGAETLNRLR